MAHRQVERGLAQASRRANAKGIQELENAALTGVVADLRDALDFSGAAKTLRAITLGRRATLDHRFTQRCGFAAQHGSQCRGAAFGLFQDQTTFFVLVGFIVIAVIMASFRQIKEPNGLLNLILIDYFGSETVVQWLANPRLALWSTIVAAVCSGLPQ